MKSVFFHPYHQPIDDGAALLDAPLPGDDTQWPEWEVFVQEKRGAAHVNVGAVHAPDAEMALILAKESFVRRQPCVNLWIVNTNDVHATPSEDDALFAFAFDRSYRNTFGFKLDKPGMQKEDDE
jgi:ring-1,2-phenylacetyl-CoA epoxidase subunit PaaB